MKKLPAIFFMTFAFLSCFLALNQMVSAQQATSTSSVISAATPPGNGFSKEDKEQLQSAINVEMDQAEKRRYRNSAYDTFFKVLILVVTLAITIFSTLATKITGKRKDQLSLASAILAACATVLSGFAFNQFDFSKRQQIYRTKKDELIKLGIELRYSDPNKERFLQRYNEVRSWNDDVPLNKLIQSETPSKTQ